MDIDKEIDILIATKEQGFVNDPIDRGGPTKYGITQATARRNGYRGDMRHLMISQAKQIYKRMYWLGPGFNKVAVCNEEISLKLFDMGVVCGLSFTCHALQRVLNVFNDRAQRYRDIKVDGILGPNTAAALFRYIQDRGDKAEIQMLKVLNGLQVNRFFELAEKNETQEKYFYGWISKRID